MLSPVFFGTNSLRTRLTIGVVLTLFAAPSYSGVVTEVLDASGDGTNQMLAPSGVTVDHLGNVYVSGSFSNNVLEVRPDGSVHLVVDANGNGNAPLSAPSGVVVDPSLHVSVTGQLSDNVFRVSPAPNVIQVIDVNGDGNSTFSIPLEIAVDGSGSLYAAGSVSNTVYRIAANHHHVTLLMDGSGDGTNPLITATGVAVDSQSRVYVTGYTSDNVFRIDPDGTIIQIMDSSGDGTHALAGPVALAVDRADAVYVVGQNSNNVFKVSATGGIRQLIDSSGDGSNSLLAPSDVQVDKFGRVYVSGLLSDNVFQIDRDGTVTRILDAAGDGTNPLDAPSSLAQNAAGDLYVAGAASSNVLRVEPDVRVTLLSDRRSMRAGDIVPVELTLENNSATAQTFSLTVRLVQPTGNWVVLVPGVTVNLPVGVVPRISFNVSLPASAPTGVYKLLGTANRAGEPSLHTARLDMPVVAAAHPFFADATAAAGVNFVQLPMNEPPNCLKPVAPAMPDPVFTCMQEYLTGSAAAGDYDGDNQVDLYVTRPYEPGILYRNLGDGTFDDVTAAAGLSGLPGTNGVAWVDVDNDGDQDLYVQSVGGTRNYLLINQGDGQFTEEALTRGAAVETTNIHFGMGVALGDIDSDGWIDLFVSEWLSAHDVPEGAPSHTRLLRNLGARKPGHFEDVTVTAGLELDYYAVLAAAMPPVVLGFAPSLLDLDDDGFPDLALTADFGTSRLYWNDGTGNFTEGTFAAGVARSRTEMGSSFADVDKDGDLDWFVSAVDCSESNGAGGDCGGNRLYRNEGNRVFSDQTDAAGVRIGGWGWGAAFLDYDNDSYADIVHTNGIALPSPTGRTPIHYDDPTSDPMRLFLNRGDTTFMQVSEATGLTDTSAGKGLLTFDYDSDGDLDVFVMNTGGPPRLYRNDGGNTKGWLRINVEGTQSNRDGIGARITVTPVVGGPSMHHEVNNQSYFLGQSERTAHFGIGSGATPVAQVRVYWPVSGAEQIFNDVARNSTLLVTEPVP